MTRRPLPGEYIPYQEVYVNKVPDGEIGDLLEAKLSEVADWIKSLPESSGDYRYAPEKWSLKEVLGHMMDTERIMSYRLLRIARGDSTPLLGFDENAYVDNAAVVPRTFMEISKEYTAVRSSTLALLNSLSEEAWDRQGTVCGYPMTVRGLAYMIAGHELHHLDIIRRLYEVGDEE